MNWLRIIFWALVGFLVVLWAFDSSGAQASWYGERHHGLPMANTKPFDMHAMTCAATKRFKLGDRLRVTHEGKSVVVTVTDRGDFERLGRTLDLSRAAFAKIADLKTGVVEVEILLLPSTEDANAKTLATGSSLGNKGEIASNR